MIGLGRVPSLTRTVEPVELVMVSESRRYGCPGGSDRGEHRSPDQSFKLLSPGGQRRTAKAPAAERARGACPPWHCENAWKTLTILNP